jgi:hypothetical protein
MIRYSDTLLFSNVYTLLESIVSDMGICITYETPAPNTMYHVWDTYGWDGVARMAQPDMSQCIIYATTARCTLFHK